MTGARPGPTREFRPTRTTRSTATAGSGGAAAAATTVGGTRPARTRSTSRPPSGVGTTNGRPSNTSGANVIGTSRLEGATGVPGARRAGATTVSTTSRTSGLVGSSNGSQLGAGMKRKTRTTGSDPDAEKESTAAKRPALSSAFSAHVTQSSLNRQLLAAHAQITELQNSLLEKQRDINRLEADLRLVTTREEEEKEARLRSEEELSNKMTEYGMELSSLKRKLIEIEADHEDLSDAYSSLSHTTQSKLAALNLGVSTRDEQIALLEVQLKEAEAKAHEEGSRAKALEELLEQLTEEQLLDEEERGSREGNDDQEENGGASAIMRMEFKEPESSADESSPGKAETENQADEPDDDEDVDADADADGEADPDEEVSMVVDTTAEDDATPRREIEVLSIRSGSDTEPNTFYEGGRPEAPAYPGPDAPAPYSSPSLGSSFSVASRSRSGSATPSAAGSEVSSRLMNVSLDEPDIQSLMQSPGTPVSVASSIRPDPLSRIRTRLSLGTPCHRRSSLGAPRNRDKDVEIIRTELTRQMSHITQLEATNSRLTNDIVRLKARAGGTELLREEKRELERRLEGMEALRTRVAELETAAMEFSFRERELQARLRDDEQVNDENNTPAKTPVGITQQLASLREAHATLLDEHGELKAALRTSALELSSAREEAENAHRDSERLSKEAEQLQDALARKEKERVLLERDAAFLRSLVSSYKNEEVANASMDGSEQNTGTVKLEQRIAQLESLLLEYKATMESLEKEVDRLQRAGGRASNRPQEHWNQLLSKAVSLEEAFKNAQAEVTRQSDRVEELEQRLFDLGGEIGSGRHVPPATRVLALRHNPAQEWADTREEVLNSLRVENDALLARLEELEEGSPSASNRNDEREKLVPRASWETLRKTSEKQADTIVQKEKRLLRLQQIYAAKSVEFREAIESILGVKLAFHPNGQVRLTSIYDLSAAFVFQPSEDTGSSIKMQLVAQGDKCPEELEGLMNIWIRDEMCIPCFMSSVTLECYDKRKREQGASGLA